MRALAKDQPIKPEAVERYLHSSFGDSLGAVHEAMKELAQQFTPEELAQAGNGLYEQFRPTVPPGKRGWGAKRELDLNLIRSLGK